MSMSTEDKRKFKPLRLFAIVNAKGELTRVYRGDTDEPWKIKLACCDNRMVSMLLQGDVVYELKPENVINVKY